MCSYLKLDVAQSFVDLSLNHTPHIIIKEIAIWEVRQPDVRGIAVAEIFSQLTLGSPASGVWSRVLFSEVGSSSGHTLDPGQHYLLQGLNVGFQVESKAFWGDEWRHK